MVHGEKPNPQDGFQPRCSECGQPVSLETTKIDRFGKPIHDECYLARVRRERAAKEEGGS